MMHLPTRFALFWLLAVGLVVSFASLHGAPILPAIEPIVYKKIGDRELRLYLHKPPGWTADDRRPAIVMIHGGGWVGGGISVFDHQSAYFAQRGLVCAVIEYRLLDKKNYDPPLICIEDSKSAMRWVRSHATELGIDPSRIAALGASAGGHLAAFLGMMDGCDDPADDLRVSARAEAMVLLNPVLHNGPGPYGYGYKRTGDKYLIYSPFHNVTPQAAPAVVFLGTEDELIPVAMIREFEQTMKRSGVRCDVHLYDGQKHSFFSPKNENRKYFNLTLAAADAFLVSLGWLPPLSDGNGQADTGP